MPKTSFSFKLFLEHINKQHPFIKFTATYDQETKTIPFLDMSIKLDQSGQFETDLFKKETAKCQYLLPSSCHPGHITRNIPYSLAYRLRRICSNEDQFEIRLQELKNDLLSRNYNAKIIEDAFKRVREISRAEAIKKVTRVTDNERTESQNKSRASWEFFDADIFCRSAISTHKFAESVLPWHTSSIAVK